MSEIQKDFLVKKFRDEAAGMLFVGANASGKTTGVNALLEEFPKSKSGLIIQETDELWLEEHPDFSIRHTLEENGESIVRYGIREHVNQALMDDLDLFVLGEVKSGEDAASLPSLVATGSQIIFTSHGENEEDGLYKVGDYIKQATGYELEQCMRFLLGIKVVCFVEKYKIRSMSVVKGWDYANSKLNIVKLDENCEEITSDSSIDSTNIDLNSFFFEVR